ncbi:TetR/AcrR family transcriptional regulator [Niveispirillum cyanobacteriorum]|uniref:TetR family transcriptional regulator n=1 Tax=Niveispirillum cyanobacteriorum TaxID=1612173 RepID=A0A2K9NAP8_9PROT|nr:TetR/AcrR family transcriptional regulator [Niveispirillum cyanobacteriorum]AUN30221.1 TetR family transcriptional regulator [Niveispirillum cyanobacteriorum]GGE56721.1 TetR family transcriptional regulator [Niveispirillum cyanobacteriorum]
MVRQSQAVLTTNPPARRESFHHGDLRAASLSAALAMVEAGGPEALSFRAVAAAVGVNHRALYRHFADKHELTLALAAQGFDGLAAVIQAGFDADGGRASPGPLYRAYVDFALDRPALYALMYGIPGQDYLTHPALAPSVAKVTRLAGKAFRRADDPPGFSIAIRDRVMRAWGEVHGLCDLWQRGALRARDAGAAKAYILALLAQ